MMKQISSSNKINNLGLMLLMATLVACGGGGGSDGTSSSNVTSTPVVTEAETEQPVIETEEPAVITSTEELVVADTFLFQSNYKLDVLVDISPEYDYLTICYADNNNQPDYGDCLLRTDLNEGEISRELLLTNDTDKLLVIAWDYADVDNPVISSWDRALDGDLLQVN